MLFNKNGAGCLIKDKAFTEGFEMHEDMSGYALIFSGDRVQ